MERTYNFQFDTLPSGLRLVTVPMQGTKTVTVMVMVGTGSKYETKDINGISHFLEHMMFKGTTKRPGALDISRELDGIGAQYNAFTDKEMTAYYAKASSEKLDIVMDVIFDIYLNSKLEESAIQTERHVVVEEINMYHDEPRWIVADNMEKLLYGDQPAGWSIAGEKETILGLKSQQFVDYFNSHYVASNTVISIAGDIDPVAIKAKVEKYFENIRQSNKVEKLSVIEKQSEPQADVYFKQTDQTHFILGFRAFNMHDPRRYPLGVLASILGGGMSSRLFSEVREKRGLCYYISASHEERTDTGFFEVDTGVNNDRALEAVTVIMEELRKIKNEGVTEAELKRAIDRTVGGTALALEQSNFLAQNLGGSVLFENKVLTPEDELAKIKAVTLEDIKAVVDEVFKNDRLNFAIVGPFKDVEPFKKLLTI
ncbi:MAG: insulinase family protein [Candidatus Pacebacteria bacterium]|nr:insulinase family protein [Candidatus Paceibacterota bacterium]